MKKFLSNRKKEFGQEDCLYLNIFTPDVPITENQQRLPVLVWFFGTTFTLTTSRDDIFGPDRFMNTKEVVIVTANYRSGPFGFLSLGIEDCPGNQVSREKNQEKQIKNKKQPIDLFQFKLHLRAFID